MKLKLWKLSQDVNDDYETFDSAVVVARGHSAASMIHPVGDKVYWNGTDWLWADDNSDFGLNSWANPVDVKVVLIGDANSGLLDEGDVVCASYNAG